MRCFINITSAVSSLFADDMILYIENPKDSTNTQKSLAFLYTNNEKIENLRKQFHSPLHRKE